MKNYALLKTHQTLSSPLVLCKNNALTQLFSIMCCLKISQHFKHFHWPKRANVLKKYNNKTCYMQLRWFSFKYGLKFRCNSFRNRMLLWIAKIPAGKNGNAENVFHFRSVISRKGVRLQNRCQAGAFATKFLGKRLRRSNI